MKRFIAISALIMVAGCSTGPVPKPSGDGAATGASDRSEQITPKERRITLNLQNASLPTALDLIARLSGMSILCDQGASGKVTMSVNNQRAVEVLEAVAKTFDIKLVDAPGNIIRVVPP